MTANGVLSESGKQETFSRGFDYLHRLNPEWKLGCQFDLNYDRSFEDHESDAIVPIVAYSVTDRLPLFVGVGLERDRTTGDTEWLARTAFEYSFFLDANRRVSLLPGGFIDFIHEEVLFSAVIAIGFTF